MTHHSAPSEDDTKKISGGNLEILAVLELGQSFP